MFTTLATILLTTTAMTTIPAMDIPLIRTNIFIPTIAATQATRIPP